MIKKRKYNLFKPLPMKSFTLLPIILFAGLFGCNAPSEKSGSTLEMGKNRDESEQKYDQEKFRRFTYFLNSNNPWTEKFLKSIDWGTFNKRAINDGIYRANCYKKDSSYFFIFDADTSLQSEELLKAFLQIDTVKSMVKSLESLGVKFPEGNNALERMYELDQKVVYEPMMGQLKTDIGAQKRFVWTLLLKEDAELIAEYKKAHSMGQAWPQITKNMKEVGVKDMEIYLSGTQAFLIMDIEKSFNMDVSGPKWQNLPKEKEWQEYVAKFQRIQPGSSIQEKWQDMLAL
jgi:L-rhamnose mutarotase